MLINATDSVFERLIALEVEPARAIAPPEVLQMLRDLAQGIRAEFSPEAWLIVEDNEWVGLCSVTRVPKDGTLDIGYGVASAFKGKGIATRAIADIIREVSELPGIRCITAETSIHNIPSQRVLERNGFEQTGTRVDAEDGELLCWRFPLP